MERDSQTDLPPKGSEGAEEPQKTADQPGGLLGIGMVSRMKMRGSPPLHLWNPPYCGEIDIRIRSDGTWFHEGSPIGRKAMVQLFASVLICDEEQKYFLITPVEKVGLKVDDAPFVAVIMQVENPGSEAQNLVFTTNVGDQVTACTDHPLRFVIDPETEGLKPYIMVRGRLEALVCRAVTYDLVELAETKTIDGVEVFGVTSGAEFFAISRADEIAA